MKKIMKSTALIICALVLCSMLIGCTSTFTVNENIWDRALYREDSVFGKGEKTIYLDVKTDEKSVTFTINTDEENLEDALTEYKLIEGEKGAYGMYVKKVNGIMADYDINKTYWSLCINGEPLQTGAKGAKIKGGEHFQFVYTK